jgi:hypothetical protein
LVWPAVVLAVDWHQGVRDGLPLVLATPFDSSLFRPGTSARSRWILRVFNTLCPEALAVVQFLTNDVPHGTILRYCDGRVSWRERYQVRHQRR